MPTAPAHPAPERHKTGWIRLVAGLAGAPAAWLAFTCIGYIVSSNSCHAHQGATLHSPEKDIGLWLWMLGFLCIAVGLISGSIAYRDWQHVRRETQGGKTQAINIGSGRTRFLSLLGLMSSGLFVVAIFFTLCALCLVSPCEF